jgi:hypothetical protein
MTGQNYLEYRQNVPLPSRIAMYFQHDGAPPHYTLIVMQHLNDALPNRWQYH